MKLLYLELSSATNSSWEPCSITTPLSSTTIFVAWTIVDNLCAIMKVVFPTIRLSKACCTMCSFSLSSALVASSNSKTFGLRMIARAIATRCF
mmetsp:Transcript_104379/g.164717  ORF Transcript_104379/g.164717 Transcript_104379/m.164717 type:complete len:93 (+) Transcript_104379:359-637(+)